jgi:hypothetical protein
LRLSEVEISCDNLLLLTHILCRAPWQRGHDLRDALARPREAVDHMLKLTPAPVFRRPRGPGS